ncbi:efflux RND transporter periplasmic adaptor subunit [Ferrimonas balearica]|uniref:efflux RND transporter periplasmic adaptor subunit n=1 Tax=Ferrimonas balearica TaxID=44012 RepID=UPI001C9523E9|nr:efflux RND transporter periplasmic adaptor subunit [Ferrimonas balearica]MBY5980402.1 efflux RND transporter periplasmic adaptor subunit [Ferrimonas balearica]MBY6107184.1 efflux RND transporter periplasmic adaptor subunit [Ferrimonas balearica]
MSFLRHPFVMASLIALALLLWILSGIGQAPEQAKMASSGEAAKATEVTARRVQAETVMREVNLYGRTEPDRMTTLRAEVKGRVLEVLVPRGARVTAGQPLLQLHQRDLPEQLARAQSELKQRQIDFDASNKLAKQGLQGRLRQAEVETELVKARAEVKRLELDLAHTTVRAPFDGVFNERMVEEGDYLAIGDRIGTVADLDPLVVNAEITEIDVVGLRVGQAANASFIGDAPVAGTVRYIASVSTEGTNTFRIEVALPNPDGRLRAGKSTELRLPLDTQKAIYITPALLALDELGNLGVKTVENDVVRFLPIEVVKADGDGIWTGGVPDEVTLITIGQGFVRDGDPVAVSYEEAGQ